MNPEVSGIPESVDYWRTFLTDGHSREHRLRTALRLLPRDPRCRLCAAPFAGVGGPLMRLVGKRRSDRNPNWCTSCFDFLSTHHGGAEIQCTMLFADVRGSTALAERSSPTEFHHLMDRFYTVAAAQVFENDEIVDKFVGDELVAMFFPLLSGDRHASVAVDAARGILTATGHDEPDGPWVPVGAGVHTGMAWVGAVGSGSRTELTALGDAVNIAARLASAAGAGEVLVSTPAMSAAGLPPSPESRELELRGKSAPIGVGVLHVGPRAQ